MVRITAAKIEGLSKACPEATLSDCERFLGAFGRKASAKRLRRYLAWRAQHYSQCFGAPPLDNALNWDLAAKYAIDNSGKRKLEHSIISTCENNETTEDDESISDALLTSDPEPQQQAGKRKPTQKIHCENEISSQMKSCRLENSLTLLPHFIVLHRDQQTGDFIRDLKGNRIIHALPAQLDPRFSKEVYTLTIALYLEHIFCSDDKEKATLVLDVRPGWGWPNAQALHMVGFIKYLANQLNLLHPNRFHRLILFPIPRAAIALWKTAIQPFLNPKVRQLIELVPGASAHVRSPPPNEKLARFIPQTYLDLLEEHRLSCFHQYNGQCPPELEAGSGENTPRNSESSQSPCV